MNGKVLLVDDDPDILDLLVTVLGEHGYETRVARDGQAALAAVADFLPDVVVLDVMMPQMDGLTVCRELRRTQEMPILILSARGEDLDKILGLEVGADDYLTKPFNPKELVARVRAMFRRLRLGAPREGEDVMRRGLVKIQVPQQRVEVKGLEVKLTPIEFNLLKVLADKPGVVLSRQDLLDRVWGQEYAGDERTVDTHVRHLRGKLQKAWPDCQYIVSVWGVGYKFEA
ncbi:MAG: response regulator [Candidatus Xenobia bacterium]